MTFINFLGFAVLKILHKLNFVQNLSLHITADGRKTLKSVQRDIAFILNLLSETVDSFT